MSVMQRIAQLEGKLSKIINPPFYPSTMIKKRDGSVWGYNKAGVMIEYTESNASEFGYRDTDIIIIRPEKNM